MSSNVPPFRLQKRNVEVFDSDKTVIAGFWQYGTLQWDDFYKYLIPFLVVSTDWSIFQYKLNQQQYGAPCPSGTEIVQPGNYVLLSTTGEPIHVGLKSIPILLHPPIPTRPNSPSHDSYYHIRAHDRDGKCLITGTQAYCRLGVAHIFPRGHGAEWTCRGYSSKITDQADRASMGGLSKIDSVQNLITLRCDLHNSWDNYEFGVDPNNNYRVISFVNGNADFNGLHLQLDHIWDSTIRPLDELFIDHFKQGFFKYVIGSREQEGTVDYRDAFAVFDLSDAKCWGTREGKEQLEVALVDRLFDHQLSQLLQDD